jgi:biofilm PGA synthesis lipoprotein PgaB
MMFFTRILLVILMATSLNARAAVILLYHHVSESTPAATSVTPAQFAEHLERREKEGFEVVRLDELVERVRAGIDPREKLASITFDDAFASIIDTAIPMLEERGWAATVFVATEPVQQRRRPMMDVDQVRDLHVRGHLVVNHSHTHLHMVRRHEGESRRAWLKRLRQDIGAAQRLLEEWVGETLPKYFAYPYGEHDPDVRALLGDMGYLGFAQRSGAVDENVDWLDVPRIPVNRQFAGWNGLGDKVRALPMPATRVQPETSITLDARPSFSMSLPEEWRHRGLNCFARGQAADIERDGNRVTITPKVDLAVGRSLINCTASAGEGRFYWYSHLWMRKAEVDQWYQEP